MLRIVIILLALAGAVAYALWHVSARLRSRRNKRSSGASVDGGTPAEQNPSKSVKVSVRGYFSGRSQQNERAIAMLDGIDDARVLTACALVAIAQSDGDMTPEESTILLNCLSERIGLAAGDALDLVDHCRGLARGVTNLDRYLSTIAAKLLPIADGGQRRDIADMTYAIAAANGPPGEIEQVAVDRFNLALDAAGA